MNRTLSFALLSCLALFSTSCSNLPNLFVHHNYDVTEWNGIADDSFAGGVGNQYRPYKIETGAQLQHISDIDSVYRYYLLMNDIDLKNMKWDPVVLNGCFNGGG